MKKLLAALLAAAMLASLAACGGGTSSQSSGSSSQSSSSEANDSSSDSGDDSSTAGTGRFDSLQVTDQPVALLIDFHSYTPSLNEEPTEESPTVFNSSRQITASWLEDKPNVTVEWSRGKDMTNNATMLEWLNIQLNAGTMPDILFAWGSSFASQGWYERLEEPLASVNYYEEGSPVWKDMFPEYLWKDSMHVDYEDNIVAIPSAIFPGPPTVYFYNKEIFDAVGITPAKDWDEFQANMKKVQDAGYIAFDPNFELITQSGSWEQQFSMRGYAWALKDKWDLDGDGMMGGNEGMRALWSGVFYMQNSPGAFATWQTEKDHYINTITKGGEAIDYTQDWIDGKLAVKQRGIWDFPTENSNTKRTFEFGMMPPPIKSDEYTADIEWTDAGPYQPQPMEAFNIVKPEVQDRPDYNYDYAVDFLKYTHNTPNLGMMVEERNGACMGAIKGCPVPASLSEWYKQSFPKNPVCGLSNASTTDGSVKLNKLLEEWFLDQKTDDEFKTEWDKIIYEDMLKAIEDQQIDTSDWGEVFVPDAAK